MSNISRVVYFFTKILAISAILTLGTMAHSQYRQLQTKEQQVQALQDVIDLIEHQYAGLEWKETLYGFNLDKKFEEYRGYIMNAQTLDEAKHIIPTEAREVLSPQQARYLYIGLISELHDGHVSLTQFSGDASTMGLRTAALHGKLLVTAVNEKYLKPVEVEFEASPYDEVIEVDGKSVAFYKRRNLNYVSNGTIEARKDEALERILEIPHALIPPFSKDKIVEIKFRRGDQEFTNTYEWTTIDAIDLTRPVNPTDAIRREEMYKTDQEFVFGAKGAVRSIFMEGLQNLVESQPEDQQKIQVQDFGASLNMEISNGFLQSVKKIADSVFNQQLQRPLTSEEVSSLISGMAHMSPVDRIKAYIIHEVDKPSIATIRIPSYSPPGGFGEVLSEINFIASIIASLKETDVDTIIIDQGTNPGGYVAYVHLLLRLFATPDQPLVGQKIQYLLNEILFSSYLQTAGLDNMLAGKIQDEEERRNYLEFIRKQMDEGMRNSSPLPFNLDTDLRTEDTYGVIESWEEMPFWDRKLVVISDSRSASGAEFFPAVIQDNGRGLVIGDGKSMGLGNPVVGHMDTLQRAEMNFRCPFAMCERFNSIFKYIESLGVDPDVMRALDVDDLQEGLKKNAADILHAARGHQAGKSYREIQVELNKNNTLQKARQFVSGDERLLGEGITQVIKQFREEISGLNEPLEESINPWLSAYTKLFNTLDELETAKNVPHEAWNLVAIPLPEELTKGDPILMTSTRKDVVLRRLEEILESGALKDKPNTTALVKNLFRNAYRIQGFFHFNEPCELLFN